MQVNVFAQNPNLKITAHYEGEGALDIAREFARGMSRLGTIFVEYGTNRETYEKGDCVDHICKEAAKMPETGCKEKI